MHGVRKHERYSQRGKRRGRGGGGGGGGGERGRVTAKRYPAQATQTNGPQIRREMAERKKEQGAEIRKRD